MAPVPPPVIVLKTNNQGTQTILDDRLLAGAGFEIRRDNGDGKYEPAGADAPVLLQGVAATAFIVFRSPPAGGYWITEAHPPQGFKTSPPTLVDYGANNQGRNCLQFRAQVVCFADDDASGGFLLVIISDAPAELPPTDTDGSTGPSPQPMHHVALIQMGLLTVDRALLDRPVDVRRIARSRRTGKRVRRAAWSGRIRPRYGRLNHLGERAR